MLKRTSLLVLAGAVCAAYPIAGRAATITFSYDAADMQFSADGQGNDWAPADFNPATNTVLVTPGSLVEFGVDVLVMNNPNPAATGTTGAATYNAAHQNQPAILGLSAYGFGMTDTKPGVASVVDLSPPGGTTTSQKGSGDANWDVFPRGVVDDVGGGILPELPESAGVAPGLHDASGTLAANTGYFGTGGGATAELLNSLEIRVNSGLGGTAVFTPTDQVGPGNLAFVRYLSGGTSPTVAPVYNIHIVSAGDGNTVNKLPALTVDVVEQVPEPASAAGLLIGAAGLVLRRRTRNV